MASHPDFGVASTGLAAVSNDPDQLTPAQKLFDRQQFMRQSPQWADVLAFIEQKIYTQYRLVDNCEPRDLPRIQGTIAAYRALAELGRSVSASDTSEA